MAVQEAPKKASNISFSQICEALRELGLSVQVRETSTNSLERTIAVPFPSFWRPRLEEKIGQPARQDSSGCIYEAKLNGSVEITHIYYYHEPF